jgi:hypothetical protein
MADQIKIWNNTPVMVFDVADGVYAYYIPSEFSRSIVEYIQEKPVKVGLIFVLVFIVTFIGWNIGHWEFGVLAIILAMIYAPFS